MALPLQDCVVLFGDSITNKQDVPGSIQSLMCEHYRRQLDILNRGFGGYNTTMARAVFDQIFAPKDTPNVPQIRLVTIWFGANDAVLPGPHGEQHVPLPTYRSNLIQFLEALTGSSSPYAAAHSPISIILITPPPVCEATLGDFGGAQRSLKSVKQYVDVVNELVDEWRAKSPKDGRWKVEGVDMYRAVMEASAGDEKVLAAHFTDGLHLSSLGYAVFWQEYQKLVQGPLARRGLDWLDAVDCPSRVPMWENVDKSRPESVVERMTHAPFRSS